jgi:hypothetical protein
MEPQEVNETSCATLPVALAVLWYLFTPNPSGPDAWTFRRLVRGPHGVPPWVSENSFSFPPTAGRAIQSKCAGLLWQCLSLDDCLRKPPETDLTNALPPPLPPYNSALLSDSGARGAPALPWSPEREPWARIEGAYGWRPNKVPVPCRQKKPRPALRWAWAYAVAGHVKRGGPLALH